MRYPGDRHVYQFLAPGDGHPTWEEHFIKKSKCKVLPVNEINKRSEVLFLKVQQIYFHLINMIYFPYSYY